MDTTRTRGRQKGRSGRELAGARRRQNQSPGATRVSTRTSASSSDGEITLETIIGEKPPTKEVRRFFGEQARAISEKEIEEF